MADEKNKTTVTTFTPESEANARVNALQAQISLLDKEMRMFQGRLSNRDPVLARTLQKENQDLRTRISLLEKALYGLILETFKPKQADDANSQHESLRQAAVEYCKKSNIDPEIWKSIVS